MKIVISEPNRKHIRLHFPSKLVLNRFSAMFLPCALEKKGLDISRQQAVALFHAIQACRRQFPDWVLVEVDSADGEHVEIQL